MNVIERKNILILEPERDVCELFSRTLESARCCKYYRCYTTLDEVQALELFGDISFDIMLVDMSTAMAGDFNLIRKLRKISPETLLIVDAYLHQKQYIGKAIALGAYGYIIKPITPVGLREKMNQFHAALRTVSD